MAKKCRFYAVVHGRQIGIFDKWDGGARVAIDHFPGADHRAFRSLALAEEWYGYSRTMAAASIIPSARRSAWTVASICSVCSIAPTPILAGDREIYVPQHSDVRTLLKEDVQQWQLPANTH